MGHEGLFRQEVLARRATSLQGDVTIAVPMAWQVIGYLLLASLVAAAVLLASASYAQVEAVSGSIVLDKGMAWIVPSRPGTVVGLTAREGQRVRAGDALVSIRSEEDMASGRTASTREVEALREQERRLTDQSGMMINAASADQSRLAAEIRGLRQELATLDTQMIAQRGLVGVAESEFTDVQRVAESGFISRRDLNNREGAVLTRRQQLAQLEQARAAKTADLEQAQRSIAHSGAAAEAQVAGILSARAALGQQLARAETAKGYSLTAPLDGTVTALTARLGQTANAQQPLMVVIPANATPRAELHVPPKAAGFLQMGQEVRLAIDAFPYQRYGTVPARIIEISGATVAQQGADGAALPVYLVTAKFDRNWVTAFGRQQALLPGMTLTGRIITKKQSLLEWLFEPLFALRNR